jgi:hypothetical protein
MTRFLVLGAVLLGATACGPAALVQCRLDAVKALPNDPGQVTPYDVVDVVRRLRACKVGPDAGPR